MIPGSSINGPRNGLPERVNYAYKGTGRDELTPPQVMLRWNASVRERGANPYPTNKEDGARLAQVERGLADLGGVRPASPPPQEPQVITRHEAMTLMSVPCWEDACHDCPGSRCACACHDDPPPRAQAAQRCDACGYLTTAIGHKIACGGDS